MTFLFTTVRGVIRISIFERAECGASEIEIRVDSEE